MKRNSKGLSKSGGLSGNRGLRSSQLKTKYTPKKRDLSGFYRQEVRRILKNRCKCVECGAPLEGTAINVAHIFPKSRFKDIAADPDNIIDLCPEHHAKLDHAPSRVEVMKISAIIQEYANTLINEDRYEVVELLKIYPWLKLS